MDRRKAYSRIYKSPRVFSQRKKAKARQGIHFLKIALRIILLIITITALNLLLTTDYLKIKNIKIKNNSNFSVKVEEIAKNELDKSRFLIYKNNNFILFSSSQLKNKTLKEIKEIKSISIKRKFPNTIEISFNEKLARIGWETGGKKYLLDEDGYLLKETDKFENIPSVTDISNLPLSSDKKVVYPNFIKFIEDLWNKIANFKLNIERIEIKETTFIVNVFAKQGFRLVFDTTRNLDDQLKKLEETLKQIGEQSKNLDYIDLTVKNKSIYKFK